MSTNEALKAAYDRLGTLTPMQSDCGRLCGAACCDTDEDGQGGVYLFPGETGEEMHWGHLSADSFGTMLVCEGMCEREKRPFACRIFPLTPVIGKDRKWTVRMDARARAMCPLVRGGLKGLDADFVRAARDAVRLLAENAETEKFLHRWQELESEYRFTL